MEQKSGEMAPLTPVSSVPESPDGAPAVGTPQCSLAANQPHAPPLSPPSAELCFGVQARSEQDASVLPSSPGSQCHKHYLLFRMQVSSLPSSS